MRFVIVLVSILALALSVNAADAHAHLDHSTPAVDSTVYAAPQEVTIWFTQGLEPVFSTVEVTDASGTRVDNGAPQISGNVMSVALKALMAGTYHVHWHAVSVDTHTTQGDFTFTVRGQ